MAELQLCSATPRRNARCGARDRNKEAPARSSLDSAARPRVALVRVATAARAQVRPRRLTGHSTPPTMPRLRLALLLFAAGAITTATASSFSLCPGQCTCIGEDCGYASTGETVEFVEPTSPNAVPCRDVLPGRLRGAHTRPTRILRR